MASGNSDVRIRMNLSPKAKVYFNTFPHKLQKARREVVEVAGKIWADETKEITTQENHIDTSLYVNSIGYAHIGGKPSDPKWDLQEDKDKTKLTVGTGSSVDYASYLEKRYNLMARGLDRSKGRMKTQTENVIKRNLEL